MSQKFKLIQDTDDDSPKASIRNHLYVASLIIIVPVAALVVLTIISVASAARQQFVRENALAEARMTQVAMPTRTPRPTSTPIPSPTVPVAIRRTVKPDSNLYAGPGFDSTIVDTLRGGLPVILIGTDATGGWYLLDTGRWIPVESVLGYKPHLRVITP